ncbi:MAG TPA: flagellar biosynthesis anti-sigma factor FlgM [Desulfuromonadales bacterium]|nr:flagellar biosynthesis anti-sigma factor FlgM [Desulfuromonadales bacterium]
MTVKISGDGGNSLLLGLNKNQKARRSKDNAKGTTQAEDRVSFSSVLQSVDKSQETTSATAADNAEPVAFSPVLPGVELSAPASTGAGDARAARVAELKAQVADGSYRPDLNKVAASLLQFVAERS